MKRVVVISSKRLPNAGRQVVFGSTPLHPCRKHYEVVGLGAEYVDQFIR